MRVSIACALLALILSSCRTTPPAFPANVPPTMENYKKVVDDQLGPLWYRLCQERGEALAVGTVKLSFVIRAAGGQPHHIKIVSSSGNDGDDWIALVAARWLRAPPFPPALLHAIPAGQIEMEETFTVLPRPPSPSPGSMTRRSSSR